jgi:ArsR family transcriptional regulator
MKASTTARKPGTQTAIDGLENLFKALADKTRLRILALLGNNEVCVCHIHDSLELPQPTVSRHLAYLRRSGLVVARRDGVWMHYQVSRSLDPMIQGILNSAVATLEQLPASTQDRKQFRRSFGQLYVLGTAAGGACCAPRAQEPQQ